MTVHLDTRPEGIDLMFRPGNSFTLELSWPASLTGRTFVSTLSSQTLSLTYSVTSMLIVVSDTVSDDFEIDVPLNWALTESGNDILIGTWVPSYHASARSSSSVSVSTGVQTVVVNYASNIDLTTAVEGLEDQIDVVAGDLATHESTALGDDLHGVIVHDWNRDGWSAFTSETISLGDLALTTPWTQSVVNNRGRLTAISGSTQQGGMRVAYLRAGTSWRDSEITSVFHAPSYWSTNNAQIGHMHRIQPIAGSTFWMAIAIWTSVVFGGDYGFLHAAVARFGPQSYVTVHLGPSSSLGTSNAEYLDRTQTVLSVNRFDFLGAKFNQYFVGGGNALELPDSTTVSFSGFADATFNLTTSNVTIEPNLGLIQAGHPTATTTAAAQATTGQVRPAGASAQLRWAPYYLSTRVVGGSATSINVQIKRWRPDEGEVPWSSVRSMSVTLTTSNPLIPTVPTEAGYCGLWGAHVYDGTFVEWGDMRFRRIDSD